jgi:hypothetical protein
MDHRELSLQNAKSSSSKRKAKVADVASLPTASTSSTQVKPTKKPRISSDKKGKGKQIEQNVWPEYFHSVSLSRHSTPIIFTKS